MADLNKAIKNNNLTASQKLAEVQRLLEAGSNADHYDISDYYETPIGLLVQNHSGAPEEDSLLQLLLNKGANPTGLSMTVSIPRYSSSEDISAMHYCCLVGNTKLVRLLLNHSSKYSYALSERNEFTPLMVAAMGGHVDIVKLLLENGERARKHHRDVEGRTAANFATNQPAVLELLEARETTNIPVVASS